MGGRGTSGAFCFDGRGSERYRGRDLSVSWFRIFFIRHDCRVALIRIADVVQFSSACSTRFRPLFCANSEDGEFIFRHRRGPCYCGCAPSDGHPARFIESE